MESCGYTHPHAGGLGLAQKATSLRFWLTEQEDRGYGDTGEP